MSIGALSKQECISRKKDSGSRRCPRGAIVTHETSNVAMVKGGAERLRESICVVHDARDVGENNFPICFPFLEGKMLDIDMIST